MFPIKGFPREQRLREGAVYHQAMSEQISLLEREREIKREITTQLPICLLCLNLDTSHHRKVWEGQL